MPEDKEGLKIKLLKELAKAVSHSEVSLLKKKLKALREFSD